MAQQKVDLWPGISGVRAIVTTRWNNRSYRPRVIKRIETYTVDSALDTDADAWTVDIGDPYGDYVDTLRRDAEVRVQLFGVGNGPDFILTGIADEVDFSDAGILSLTGRDYSSLAMDSTVPPQQFRHVRAWAVVGQQATELGFPRTKLTHGQMVPKVQHTDGSESYWEFWYRLYRKEKMWIWTTANGTLVADFLNYGGNPVYFLGRARSNDPPHIRNRIIPVEQVSVRKSTQNRLGEVWVYYHKGKIGWHEVAVDPTTVAWKKRPRKILLDSTAHTPTAATKAGWEEIFESKVGELEYSVTIPDPGFMLQQNQIARLRIPELNIAGDFFVVGVQAQASVNGAYQVIRLRDRGMALTNRVPTEPKALGGAGPKDVRVETELGQEVQDVIGGATDVPQGWGNYFVQAAQEFHGGWDYNLFLAVLIGIAWQETGGSFLNERENGGPGGSHIEWYPFDPTSTSGNFFDATVSVSHKITNFNSYREQFANESGDGYVTRDYGVGPMQLTDIGAKHDADDHMQANYRDEFQGGRWHPEHNIWAGAKLLRSDLDELGANPANDDEIWMGVMAYNRGVAGARSYFSANGRLSSYAQSVKGAVNSNPGYLADVKTARDSAIQNAAQKGTQPTNLFETAPAPKPGRVNSPLAIDSLTHITPVSSKVNLVQVDYRLLVAVNNLAAALGETIVITSGFRTFDDQLRAWNDMHHNPLLAADPHRTTSNHQIGEAVDCTINNRAIGLAVPAATMEKFGIHCSVYVRYGTDPYHVTLLNVWG